MGADTQARPEDAAAKPKRKFKFPTAFTILFFVLVAVWILTFIITPGTYSYVSCDGGTAKPIPGTYHSITVDRSIQESIYDLWISPVNGLYGIRTPAEPVTDPTRRSSRRVRRSAGWKAPSRCRPRSSPRRGTPGRITAGT